MKAEDTVMNKWATWGYGQGKKAGVREVVEKGLKVNNVNPEHSGKGIVIFISEAKLKEWVIKEEQ